MPRPSKRSVPNAGSRTRQVDRDIEFKKPSEISRARSWCIYGPSGTGKTTLTGSFPKPICLIDCRDEGTDSLLDMDEHVSVRAIETSDDFEETFWWLKRNPKRFKTVVIDTTTMLQQMRVEEVTEKKNLKNKNPGDWGTMTKQEWGEVAAWLKTWITNYRSLTSLGIEVVFIAQDRLFNVDEDEGEMGEVEPEMGPRLSPSVKSHLCAAVTIIGATFIRTYQKEIGEGKKKRKKSVVEYCIRLGPNSSYITKIRKPKSVSLPNFLTDPTYEEILEIIEGE